MPSAISILQDPASDIPIFLRLISDLVPGLELVPKVDQRLAAQCKEACKETGLIPEDAFIKKVLEFQELLDVRHSVMLLGPAGCGKTAVWKTLACSKNLNQPKPVAVYDIINPKSVTTNELYGYMTLAKDWRDGVLSIVMRNMSKNVSPYTSTQTSKWVVLDGDIDAVWIESMNTVMDDNKVLTLVSNERIPLSASMRMVFEIHTLKMPPRDCVRAGIRISTTQTSGTIHLCSMAEEPHIGNREELLTRIDRATLGRSLSSLRWPSADHSTQPCSI